MPRTRVLATIGALALIAAACGDAGESDSGASLGTATNLVEEEVPVETTGAAAPATSGPGGTLDVPEGLPEGPSALRNRTAPEFPEPLVDPALIISGGPPPDGIPPIDEPVFIGIDAADAWLDADEPVVVLEIGGDARAYPVQVMIWHEIVNDVVGGVPVSVTYCPLCNSAATYRREIREVETTFGTSGRLLASALVMYDRATESLWTHFDGRAVVGLLAGEELESIPSPLLSWEDFKTSYPDGTVLDRDATGFVRRYGANPYVGYDDADTFPFLYRGDPDSRAVAKERIVGVTIGDDAKAYTLSALATAGASATHDVVGGTDIVILWASGQASALDDASISGGRDVGSVGVFVPEVDGQALTFTASVDGYVDAETSSTWDVTGLATAGPMAGKRLERLPHLDTFWFAWATYRPDTELITEV